MAIEKILTGEEQADILYQAAKNLSYDGHITWLDSKKRLPKWTEARAVQMSAFHGTKEQTPVKNSYMFCDALDMCFFFDKNNHASFSYSGVATVNRDDIVKHNLVDAFRRAEIFLAEMQKLADEVLDKKSSGETASESEA